MSVYQQNSYKDLEEVLEKHRNLRSNVLLLTLPGLGGGHLCKSYWEKNKDKVSYIDSDGDKLAGFNLLNFGLDRKPGDILIAERYVKEASLDNKFAILVHDPSLIQGKEYRGSYLSNHVYENYYLGARRLEDIELMIDEIDSKLDKDDVKKIYELSGGIAQLAKYLAVNWSRSPNFDNKEIDNILEPMIKVIHKVDQDELVKLGIVDNDGKLISRILAEKIEIKPKANIKINFDLSFEEDNKASGEKLTVTEKQILEKMKQNGGILTKEEASDIKWGEGKYDDYSDQAINKTMRRLDEKLNIYTVQTVPKIGFVLKKR